MWDQWDDLGKVMYTQITSLSLTSCSPGTLAQHQSQLTRLREVNEDIRTSMEPLAQIPPQKVFKHKYPIPVLPNY